MILFIVIFLYCIQYSYPYSPLDSTTFKITDSGIVGEPKLGDTIQFEVDFTSTIRDSITVALYYSDLIKPLENSDSTNLYIFK